MSELLARAFGPFIEKNPWQSLTIAGSTFLPMFLVIFIRYPEWLQRFGTPAIVLLSIAATAPLFIICVLYSYVASAVARLKQGQKNADGTAKTVEPGEVTASDDIVQAAVTTNVLLYAVAISLYFAGGRIALTLLIPAGIMSVALLMTLRELAALQKAPKPTSVGQAPPSSNSQSSSASTTDASTDR